MADDGEEYNGTSWPKLMGAGTAVNKYPNVDLKPQLSSEVSEPGASISIQAQLKRLDGPASDLTFPVPFFPDIREEAWWLCLGSPSERTILVIKRIACKPGQSVCPVALDFSDPPTSASLKLYLISECWLGCDQESDLSIVVNLN